MIPIAGAVHTDSLSLIPLSLSLSLSLLLLALALLFLALLALFATAHSPLQVSAPYALHARRRPEVLCDHDFAVWRLVVNLFRRLKVLQNGQPIIGDANNCRRDSVHSAPYTSEQSVVAEHFICVTRRQQPFLVRMPHPSEKKV